MFLKKEATFLNLDISDEKLKNVQKKYEKGNFRDAKKELKNIDISKLKDNEKEEYEKLTSLLALDMWGIIAGVSMLIVVLYFFIDYSNI